MTIRVVIADDHPAVLRSLEYLLSAKAAMSVVGKADNPTDLGELLGRTECDVLVTDYMMFREHQRDGMFMLGLLQRRFPELRVVVLTGIENPSILQGIQKSGGHAVVAKLDDPACLEQAIQLVYAGKSYLSPAVCRMVNAAAKEDSAAVKLSPSEAEVVRLFVQGLSVLDISKHMVRSIKTISAQKAAAMKKLGVRTEGELIRYAVAHGMTLASHKSGAATVD